MRAILWYTGAVLLALTCIWWVHPGNELSVIWLGVALWWCFLGGALLMRFITGLKIRQMMRKKPGDE